MRTISAGLAVGMALALNAAEPAASLWDTFSDT